MKQIDLGGQMGGLFFRPPICKLLKGLVGAERIRTSDLLVPNQALYQAEPRPELSSLVCCTPRTQARTIEFVSDTQKLRALPAVHEVLDHLPPSLARFPRALVVSEVRRAIDAAREEILAGVPGSPAIAARVEHALADLERPSLRHVINATGVVLHTNLGRAPLGPLSIVEGYSNLEYDVAAGRRGKRDVTPAACWNACWARPASPSTTMPPPSSSPSTSSPPAAKPSSPAAN